MSAATLLHPLLQYVLMAAGLGLCLYLFITVKAEIRGLQPGRIADQQRIEALETTLAEALQTVQRLESDLREVERQTGMLVARACQIGIESEQAHASSAHASRG